jgi:hypothetical protein
MEHVGIDVHKKETQICRLTEDGELIERRVRTLAERFGEVLGGRVFSWRPRRRASGSRGASRAWGTR